MGYTTYYSGELEITPPLTNPEYLRFAKVCGFWNSDDILNAAKADVFAAESPVLTAEDEAIKKTVGDCYGVCFTLEPARMLAFDERLKGYDLDINLPFAARWLAENGHQLNGSITWDGDESGDQGTIHAKHLAGVNLVEFVRDVITSPAPSWERG